MDTAPDDRLRSNAKALGESLRAPSAAEAFRLLTRLIAPAGAGRTAPAEPGRLGAWVADARSGLKSFRKDETVTADRWLWSDTPLIEPKGHRRRIVLIGESVARGYFLDPAHNPAKSLLRWLEHVCGRERYEVVDLARVDLLLDPLLELLDRTPVLRPDAVVVMAGNNWHPGANVPVRLCHAIADCLDDGGQWPSVATVVQDIYFDEAARAFDAIASFAARHSIPCVVALPAFNLVDWFDNVPGPPGLDGESEAVWHNARTAAEQALSLGRFNEVERHAKTMIAVDKQNTPVGLRLLASACEALGDDTRAETLRVIARDVAGRLPVPLSPRCCSVVYAAAERLGSSGEVAVVDLTREFRQHWSNGRLDRRVFLDYCHLTLEAMGVAMAAVGGAVVKALGENAPGDVALGPDRAADRVRAESHWLAAIHCSNWGQPDEIVRHHCREARAASPRFHEDMTLYLESVLRHSPAVLCAAFDRLLARCPPGSPIEWRYGLASAPFERWLNVTLKMAMDEPSTAAASSTSARLDELLIAEHAIDGQRVDLLDWRYAAQSGVPTPEDKYYSYYRAFAPNSIFTAFCSAPRTAMLMVSARLPRGTRDAPATVRCNGVPLFTMLVSSAWRTECIVVPAEALRRGANVLEILWPMSAGGLEERRSALSRRFRDGQLLVPYSIFGEVCRLSIESVA